MSALNKALKKAAKPYAQEIAEKISVLHIYWDILKPIIDDTVEAKNVDRSIWALHDSLAKGATECLGLKITHDQAEGGEMTIFSGGGPKQNPNPPPPPPT